MKHTKLTSLLLVLAMTITSVVLFVTPASAEAWNGKAVATAYAGGTGTENDPYLISTPAELAYMASQTNLSKDLTAHFKLTADLDMGGHSLGKQISRNSGKNFNGVLDGDGYTIFNIAGNLMGYANTCTIKNLNIVAQGDFTLIGNTTSATGVLITIENCNFYLNDVTSTSVLLVSVAKNAGVEFTNCSVYGNVVSASTAAVFIGKMNGGCNATLTNCFNYADITAAGAVSAFALTPQGTLTMTDCANYGNLTSSVAANVGAFVSYPAGALTATFKGCANYGAISMTAEDATTTGTGGFVGGLGSTRSYYTWTDCANYGAIKASSGYAGGIFGTGDPLAYTANMLNVLTVGSVTSGTADAAGQVAGNLQTAQKANYTIANVYYTVNDYGTKVADSKRTETNVTQISDLSKVPAEFDAAAWTVGALPVASAASLTLGDSLSLNVYAKVLPVPAAQAATHLYADGAKASVGTSVTVNGVAYVQFTVSDIKAAKMTEQLNLQLGSADLAFGAPLAYGVMDYAERMTGKGDAKLDALLGALADYAKAAAGEDVDVDVAYAAVELAPVANVDNTYVSTIALDLTDSVRPILQVADGVAKVKVEIYGNDKTYNVTDGEVIIDCLTATSLNNVMTLTFLDAAGNELGTTEYSVANYLLSVLGDLAKAEYHDLAKALAVYMQAARAYNGLD